MNAAFRSRHILVVEDDYMIATDLCRQLEQIGARVVGPAPSVERAMRLLESEPRMDAAVLDINLGGETSYPIAEALQLRLVPFLFATGYNASHIPGEWQHVPHIEKPLEVSSIAQLLPAAGSA